MDQKPKGRGGARPGAGRPRKSLVGSAPPRADASPAHRDLLEVTRPGRGGARPGAGRPRKSLVEEVRPRETGEESNADMDRRHRKAVADMRCMERDRLAGTLVALERVSLALTTLGAEVRQALTSLPAKLGPIVAGRDEHSASALIEDEIEVALAGLSDRLRNLTFSSTPSSGDRHA